MGIHLRLHPLPQGIRLLSGMQDLRLHTRLIRLLMQGSGIQVMQVVMSHPPMLARRDVQRLVPDAVLDEGRAFQAM